MKKIARERFSIITFTIVFLVGILSYGAGANNSDAKPVAVSSSSAPTINDSAKNSNQANDKASKVSQMIGVGMMAGGAACAASCPTGCCSMAPMLFGMGAMSFGQASANSGAAYNSGLTGYDSSAWTNPFGDYKPPGLNDPNKPAGPGGDGDLGSKINSKKLAEIQKGLLSTGGINGVKADTKTGKFIGADGKVFDPAALGNAQAMADAGFSAADVAAANNFAKKLEKDALKKLGVEGIGAATAENGYSEGGASGSKSSSDTDGGVHGFGGRGLASAGGGGAHKIPSNQIAGLTKNFNGERIGVSAENIFNMMTRRYKTKEKQNSFFDPSELVKMPQ